MWVSPRLQKEVGKCLAEARIRAHVTQAALAKALGKPQSFVSFYERGQRRVDLLEFLLIADEIDADPRKLFSEIVKRCGQPRGKRG